jgi:hypothetical protein
MGAYNLDTVLKKWERGELTAEQTIGQILLLLRAMTERIGQLETQQEANRRQAK